MIRPFERLFESTFRNVPGKVGNMVCTLGYLEQRSGANPPYQGVFPASQSLGPDQRVVVQRELRLKQDLDFVTVNCGE